MRVHCIRLLCTNEADAFSHCPHWGTLDFLSDVPFLSERTLILMGFLDSAAGFLDSGLAIVEVKGCLVAVCNAPGCPDCQYMPSDLGN